MDKSINYKTSSESSSDETVSESSSDETLSESSSDETLSESSSDETSKLPKSSKSIKKTKKMTKKKTKKSIKKPTKKSTNSKKIEDAKRKAEEKQRKAEEKRIKNEEKQRKADERKRIIEEKKRIKAEEKRIKDEKKQRKAEERKKIMEEKNKIKEEKQKIVEEKKRIKEEEKRKKEEEKKIKEKKLIKDQIHFKSFFKERKILSNKERRMINDLIIKKNKTIANLCPSNKSLNLDQFDELINQQNNDKLYLDNLNKKTIKYAKKQSNRIKFKLLQFEENYRPPFYGRFLNKCSFITGRNPFKKDISIDYDVDSDDEYLKKIDENSEFISINDKDDEENDTEIENEFEDFIDDSNKRKSNSNKSSKKRKLDQVLVPQIIGCLFLKDENDIEKFGELKECKVKFIN